MAAVIQALDCYVQVAGCEVSEDHRPTKYKGHNAQSGLKIQTSITIHHLIDDADCRTPIKCEITKDSKSRVNKDKMISYEQR